ncbi:MAG: helix-turn-helix transcriptional regulator [Planctomycetota bacterium]|jgi:AraC-like DNA-binding protein
MAKTVHRVHPWGWNSESPENRIAFPYLYDIGFAHWKTFKAHWPQTPQGYKIQFAIRNVITFEHQGRAISLSPGQAIFCCPWQELRAPGHMLEPCDTVWVEILPTRCTPQGDLAFDSPQWPMPPATVNEIGRRLAAHSLSVLTDAEAVLAPVQRMRTELTEKKCGYETAVNLCIADLLLQLDRQLATQEEVTSAIPEAIKAVLEKMWKDPAHHWTLEALARETGLSKNPLNEGFLLATGSPPHKFLNYIRLTKSKALLTQTEESITDIAFSLGFNSSAHFSHAFSKTYHMSPSDFRKWSRQGMSAAEKQGVDLVIHQIRKFPDKPWQENTNVLNFGDLHRFTKLFKKVAGLSPDTFQKQCQSGQG